MSEQYDILFAVGLPLLAIMQGIFLWRDAKKGQVRLSPMHYFSRERSPKAYLIVLVVNVVLVVFMFFVGMYYLAKVTA